MSLRRSLPLRFRSKPAPRRSSAIRRNRFDEPLIVAAIEGIERTSDRRQVDSRHMAGLLCVAQVLN